MGSVQIEVKSLRGKRPIVFAWNNPVKNVIECFLVSCPCQRIGFPETSNMATGPDGVIIYDQTLKSSLEVALTKADLFTHASLDHIESLISYIIQQEKAKKKKRTVKKGERKKSHKEKKPKLMKETSLEFDSAVSVEEVPADVAPTSNVPSNAQQLEIEMDETIEEMTTPSSEDESTHEQNIEEVPVAACVNDIPSNAQKLVKGKVETMEDILETASLDKKELPLEKCLKDENTPPGEEQDERDVNCFVENVDTSVQSLTSDNVVNNIQDAVNSCETTVPVMNNSLLDTVTLVNVDPVSAAAVRNAVVSVVSDSEGGLWEVINCSIVKCPEIEVTYPQVPPAINNIEDPMSPAVGCRTKVKFIRHLTEEERQKKFRFWSDREKDNRRKLEDGYNAFLCHVCGKVLTSQCMINHMRIHSNDEEDKNHICEICGRAFPLKGSLNNHLKTHDANRKLTCRYCPKGFRSISGRTNHERRHFAIYPDTCEKCGKQYVDSKNYRRHLEKVHGLKPSSIRVSRKVKTYSLQKKPFTTCTVCKKEIWRTNEKAHMDMHDGKLYTCTTCGKVMAYSTRYYHNKIHKLGAREPCTVCGKVVVDMTVHMRTHTGEKPIKCRYCDKMFSVHGTRQAHEVNHTGKKPHQCTICDKSWMDRSCYRNHMKKIHPGEPIKYKRRSVEINLSQRGTLLLQPLTSAPVE